MDEAPKTQAAIWATRIVARYGQAAEPGLSLTEEDHLRDTLATVLRKVMSTKALGRVDGFEDDEAKSECDEGCKVLVRFLATERNALEALELADEVFDTGAGSIECLREERWPVLGR